MKVENADLTRRLAEMREVARKATEMHSKKYAYMHLVSFLCPLTLIYQPRTAASVPQAAQERSRAVIHIG